jgi:hypothetical protein
MAHAPEGLMGPTLVLDYMGFAVRDGDRSKAFFEQAVAPLGSVS